MPIVRYDTSIRNGQKLEIDNRTNSVVQYIISVGFILCARSHRNFKFVSVEGDVAERLKALRY